MYVGQPEIPPLMVVRETLMVEPQLMKQRCLKIVDAKSRTGSEIPNIELQRLTSSFFQNRGNS